MNRFRLPDNYDDGEWLHKQRELAELKRERREELREDESQTKECEADK